MFCNFDLNKECLVHTEYTKEELELFYYRDYPFNLSQVYNVDFISFEWYDIDQLHVNPKLLTDKFYTESTTNNYLKGLDDKTLLAKDILNVGTYWPIMTRHSKCGDLILLEEGHHRVASAKLLNPSEWNNRKLLSLHFTMPSDDRLKVYYKSTNAELPKPVRMRAPLRSVFPDMVQGSEQDMMRELEKVNGYMIDSNTVEIEINTYREFITWILFLPWRLENFFYDHKDRTGSPIVPISWINNMNEFISWEEQCKGEQQNVNE